MSAEGCGWPSAQGVGQGKQTNTKPAVGRQWPRANQGEKNGRGPMGSWRNKPFSRGMRMAEGQGVTGRGPPVAVSQRGDGAGGQSS